MLDVQRQSWEEGYTRLKVKGAGRKSRPNMKWYMGQEVKEVKRVKRKKEAVSETQGETNERTEKNL